MTKERIEDFRKIVLPFMQKRLLEINYENLGESDAEEFTRDFNEILDLAIKALEQEPTTKNDLGVDGISRPDALALFCDKCGLYNCVSKCASYRAVEKMPPVTPQEPKTGHCKDCKWWKDSDGKYRRGCGAESQCPINTFAVYCGEGYCYMFESQESEVEDGNERTM